MDLLSHMALFVEVVKAKGFRRAAETLDMSNSTLSRRIAELENAIGLRLLQRTTRKIELTEAGRLYYERCTRIVEEARMAHDQLSDMLDSPRGTLRVSMSVDFGVLYIAPLLAEFAELYPLIRFELELSPKLADLIGEPFDVAIRMGAQPDSSLIARQIAVVPRILYASPRYLARHGEPQTPADLARHQCLRMAGAANGNTWKLQREGEHGEHGEQVEVKVEGRFDLNNMGMIRRLAVLDMGIAMLADTPTVDSAGNVELQRVLPDWTGHPTPVFAMTATRLLPAKTQRFLEFLRTRLMQ